MSTFVNICHSKNSLRTIFVHSYIFLRYNYLVMIIGFDGSRAFRKDRTGTEEYSYQLLKHLSKIDSKNQYLIYTNPFIDKSIGQLMKFPENFKKVEIPWPRFWTQ